MNHSAPTPPSSDPDEFWRVATPQREPLRWKLFVPALSLLLLVNVPWYLTPEVADRQFHGLPVFAWICLGTSLTLSILTCSAALWHWQSDSDTRRDEESERSGRKSKGPSSNQPDGVV